MSVASSTRHQLQYIGIRRTCGIVRRCFHDLFRLTQFQNWPLRIIAKPSMKRMGWTLSPYDISMFMVQDKHRDNTRESSPHFSKELGPECAQLSMVMVVRDVTSSMSQMSYTETCLR